MNHVSQDQITSRLVRISNQLPDVFRLPLPYASGASFCGAIVRPEAFGIVSPGAKPVGVAGRGLSEKQAFESCMGEACEYLSMIERENDPLTVPWPGETNINDSELTWALEGAGLAASTKPDKLEWVRANSLPEKTAAYFPSELVLRSGKTDRVGTRSAESNGVSAGRNVDEAFHAALMEVTERDAVALWWYGGEPASAIDDNTVKRLGVMRFAQTVRRDDARPWWLLDITSDLGIPTIAALSSDDDGTMIVGGFCSRLDPVEAMKGAFLEMCQMELAHEMSLARLGSIAREHLSEKDLVWIDRSEKLNCVDYPELIGRQEKREFASSSAEISTEHIASRLRSMGFTTYRVNLSREEIGIPVVRVLVPGLQSSKPDCISDRLREVAAKNSVTLDGICKKSSPI